MHSVLKDSTATQIDFPEVRIEMENLNIVGVDDEEFHENGLPLAVKPDKTQVLLTTSNEVFRMVKIEEPQRKIKPPVKLPALKIKRQAEKPNA